MSWKGRGEIESWQRLLRPEASISSQVLYRIRNLILYSKPLSDSTYMMGKDSGLLWQQEEVDLVTDPGAICQPLLLHGGN